MDLRDKGGDQVMSKKEIEEIITESPLSGEMTSEEIQEHARGIFLYAYGGILALGE